MKLKTIEQDGKTFAEVQDGKPVYVADDGTETALDVPGMKATITKLNGEAMGHRKAKEDAEKALKAFEGIEDPAAALKALETMQGMDGGKLMDAEKAAAERKAAVEAATKTFTEQLETERKARADAEGSLHKEMIGGRFARSGYISEKLAVPARHGRSHFRRQFPDRGRQGRCARRLGQPDLFRCEPRQLCGLR
ncbi:DUF6651 domain-containing protein [Ponticoccus litoralis]|uniref:DUF6651 domain-containing protein n=1 Tax=Ponticoccus litoralis TaxID=422297 RepID=A0AAW9SGX2_9RHOB